MKKERLSKKEIEELTGIKGWLIVIIAGLIFSILYLLTLLFSVTELGLNLETFVISLLLILNVFLLYEMTGKKTMFPVYFIAIYWIEIVIGIIISIAAVFSGVDLGELIPTNLAAIVAGAIWTEYMIQSKRVKYTFVK